MNLFPTLIMLSTCSILISCNTLKKDIIVEIPLTVSYYGLDVVRPNQHFNYSVTTIENNIDNSEQMLIILNESIDSLKELQSISSSPGISKINTEEVPIQINDLEKKRQNVQRILSEWESIGFEKSAYRIKQDGLKTVWRNKKITESEIRLGGIQLQRHIGAVTDVYGEALQVSDFIYYDGASGTRILKAYFNKYNAIYKVELSGKDGYLFAGENMLADDAGRFIGVNGSEILDILGKATSHLNNSIIYEIPNEDYIVAVEFYCSHDSNYNCSRVSISIKWNNTD